LTDLDLIGLGSAIVDFAPVNPGVSLSEIEGFTPSGGGAVANLLVAASRLGLRTGFVGCVGDDEFGKFILRDFEKEGVDVSHSKQVRGVATSLAFYSVDKKGERHYMFYRFPGYSDPESRLKPRDIDPEYIAQSRAIHFSEALLRSKSSRDAVFKALRVGKQHGLMISYDPNVRSALWVNKKEFNDVQRRALNFADVFLSTIDELALISGTKLVEKAMEKVRDLGPSIMVIRGKDHYRVASPESDFKVPIFEVEALDTSGAGDAFDAGFLAGLLKKWPLDKAVELGSAVAALKVMSVGTRKGLPRLEAALKFIEQRKTSTS